jgi:hypothetical protein
MLCQTCQNIFRGPFTSKYVTHHASIYDVQRAALDNCYICRVLWTVISPLPPNQYPIPATTSKPKYVASERTISHTNQGLHFWVRANNNSNWFDAGLYFVLEDASGAYKERIYDPADWVSSLRCAKRWLFECSENHTKCRSHPHSIQQRSLQPTRLIEIGQPEPHMVRLRLCLEDFIHKQVSTCPRYATLSHCWGSTESLKLTSASFQRLRDGISITDLAKTFQDAIFTARSLDIGFLWIDSLCILQDSKHDWQHESALMSEVYRNGILNIAASVASDGEAGCFPARSSSALDPCIVQTDWDDHKDGIYRIYNAKLWDHTLERMPLSKRAWVVQETLLAPRVLYLCGNQMLWQCYELTACEEFPNGIPPTETSILVLASVPVESKTQAFGTTSDPEKRDRSPSPAMRNLWRDIVRIYTRCELTYASDRLVALSGVAKIMCEVLNDEYCAGLWKSRFTTELFWCRESSAHRATLPSTNLNTYQAPSWSWACLDEAIDPLEDNDASPHTSLIDILECDVKTATEDRTGAVVNGVLRITGWLATIQILPTDNPYSGPDYFFDGKQWRGSSRISIIVDYILPPSCHVHCLPLFVRVYDPGGFRLHGLLLIPAETAVGQFRRVGRFSLDEEDLGLGSWPRFPDLVNESWMEYEEAFGDGKYIISIV